MNIVKLLLFFYTYACLFPVQAQFKNPDFQMVGKDSAITYASNKYKAGSFLHTFLMGKNYRKEWQQPVTLPVFRLSATNFIIEELGGGMQTKSLKLEDSKGKQWALRTVDKDVAGALSGSLKKSFIKNLMQDHISAALPYGPLVIGPLAKRAGITAAQPVIYFVADDSAYGKYRNIFANTVSMVEERDPRFEKTENTKEVLRDVQKSNKYQVNQRVLLRARLFDMLISDWDRHYDNWRWGQKDSAGITYYHAVPRDRDWAFYKSGGLVPRLLRLAALRFLISFKAEPKHIKSLSYKAHTFDKVFLNELTAEDWLHAIDNLQQTISDQDIEEAVKNLPPAIFATSGKEIIKRLKARRNDLKEPVMKYYNYLSRMVQIEGSNDAETFSFLPAEKGFRLLIVRGNTGSGHAQKIYERVFSESETYQVTINGLAGDDHFFIDESVASTIRVKLNGGTGNDKYELLGNIRTQLHDYKAEQSSITNKNGAKVRFHSF